MSDAPVMESSGEDPRAGAGARASGRTVPPRREWRVREATHEDVPRVAAAVHALLRELGATPPDALAMQAAARALLEHPAAGALLVAYPTDGGAHRVQPSEIVGVLGCSWPQAIHTAGRYALIQDLWVNPSWRGRGVGGGLLRVLYALAREHAISRVEVGLPTERYTGLPETEAFYLAAGFAPLGTRMRRALP